MAPWARLSFTRTIHIYVLAAFNQPANILLFPRNTYKSLRFSLFFNICGTQLWVSGFFPVMLCDIFEVVTCIVALTAGHDLRLP